MPFFVFEHGHVRESGRVVFEMQRRGKRVGLAAGDAQKQSGDNRRSDFASHDSAQRFAGGSTGSAVALGRFGKIAEATEFFVALFQQLIDRDFQEALRGLSEVRGPESQQPSRDRDARRHPAPRRFHPPR